MKQNRQKTTQMWTKGNNRFKKLEKQSQGQQKRRIEKMEGRVFSKK